MSEPQEHRELADACGRLLDAEFVALVDAIDERQRRICHCPRGHGSRFAKAWSIEGDARWRRATRTWAPRLRAELARRLLG